jgi:hypothetical protein
VGCSAEAEGCGGVGQTDHTKESLRNDSHHEAWRNGPVGTELKLAHHVGEITLQVRRLQKVASALRQRTRPGRGMAGPLAEVAPPTAGFGAVTRTDENGPGHFRD